MTKPSQCPHGKCLYCLGGVEVNTPQSYTGKEPAAMRGIQYEYDPFAQVKGRIEQLESTGHACDKIELIVMGGTFTAQEYDYQKTFIRRCFDAMNDKNSKTLTDAQKRNEKAKHRCVGLTIETRTDWCKPHHIDNILEFGGTRVELGVQNPDNEIYALVQRGHTVEDVVNATQLAKDSFLKVGYHIMPGLPGSNPEKDVQMFEKIFKEPDFMPDMLKIYPCLLVKPEYGQKELHKMFIRKKWEPYSDEEAADVIVKGKAFVPKWCRIMRIQRDIPSPLVFEGVKHSNLREIITKKMEEKGLKCRCIRCREIKKEAPAEAKLLREDYVASGGKEIFLSIEDTINDKLIAFLRLRKPGKPFRPEINEHTAGIRELHVYGPVVPIGEKPKKELQHRGYGRMLLEEAEKIAKEELDARKMIIISGVGVRRYFSKLGYGLEGPYMAKKP
jgi:elongator complex protein 3